MPINILTNYQCHTRNHNKYLETDDGGPYKGRRNWRTRAQHRRITPGPELEALSPSASHPGTENKSGKKQSQISRPMQDRYRSNGLLLMSLTFKRSFYRRKRLQVPYRVPSLLFERCLIKFLGFVRVRKKVIQYRISIGKPLCDFFT